MVSLEKPEVITVGVAGEFAGDPVLPHRTTTWSNGFEVSVAVAQALLTLPLPIQAAGLAPR